MSSTTIFIICEATCFNLVIGHHQAFLHYESVDAIYMLGSWYVYIDKIYNSNTSVTQVEVMCIYVTMCS
jgi:hypothetical protein